MNTVEILTTGKSCSLYWELLHPILGIPLASIGELPFIGKSPIEAKAIPSIGYMICQWLELQWYLH